ncbi:cytochrome P450, partial [Neoconidiobolus thromboides FSU 785]
YLLSSQPDRYEKVREVICTVFSGKDLITYNKCKSECHYLNAVIHEGLRMIPVVGGNAPRLVPKGGRVIDGYFIPEGVVVGVSMNSIHNLPSNWKDPSHFNAKRWLKNGKFQSNPNFMPFLLGPRGCVGRTLAWMELYLVTANLVRNFTFERENEKVIRYKNFITTQPIEPINVYVTKN